MSPKDETTLDTPDERTEAEIAADEARATTRTDAAEASKVSPLSNDDPRAGTVDDPNVQDPYEGLRNQQKLREAVHAGELGAEEVDDE